MEIIFSHGDFADVPGHTAISAMPKRKRDEQQHGPPEALRIQLDLGTKKLAHSLKLARGIERQKLGRRQKDALAQQLDSASNNTNARIEAEIGALKVGLCLRTAVRPSG